MPFGQHRLLPVWWHRPASASALHAPETGLRLLYQAAHRAQLCFAVGRSKRRLSILPLAPGGDARAEAAPIESPFVEPTSRSRCPSFRIGNGNFPFPEIIARTVPLVLLAKPQWATALSHDIHF
jgi:hypothetical protein